MYFTRLGLTSKVESQTSKNSFRGEYPDAFYFALYCISSVIMRDNTVVLIIVKHFFGNYA